MPVIKPPGGEVSWSMDEGTLGIVGVAPWATIDFCKVLYKQVRAIKDWHYPRVIADINTKLPSRGRYFQLGEIDPSPSIAATIRELYEQGATVVVVPCNTAHILYNKWAKDTPVPIPHIVRETLAQAKNAGIKSFTPLTSSSLAEYNLYGKFADEYNLNCERLGKNDQDVVADMINDVKMSGTVSNKNLNKFDEICLTLHGIGVESVIMGCTELTLLEKVINSRRLKPIDSNTALALSALKLLNIDDNLFPHSDNNELSLDSI